VFASVIESERFTHAEFTNGHRHGNVAIGCDGTKPSRELDRGTKQVVIVVGDRFTGTNPNTDMERRMGLQVAFMNASLDGYRKDDSGHDRGEGCHYPVTGVFDLATVISGELVPNYRIVFAEQLHVTFIAELLCLSNRATDIGEHNGSYGWCGVCSAGRMIG
jgi:hypothetical protein